MTRALLLGMVMSGAAVFVQAENMKWIGPDGGSWGSSTNWDSGTVPTTNDIIWSLQGGHVVIDVPDATALKAENGGFDNGSVTVTSAGRLDLLESLEIARRGSGNLVIDGGSVTVATNQPLNSSLGAVFNEHYTGGGDSVLEIKNGGSLTAGYFRCGDGDNARSGSQTIKLSDTATILTRGNNNVFGNTDATYGFTNRLVMTGGTFISVKRCYWGGAVVELDISGGLFECHDQFNLGSKNGTVSTLNLSGGELSVDTSNFYFGTAEATTGTIYQTGGTLTLVPNSYLIFNNNTTDSKATYEISGGTLDAGYRVQMKGDATMSIVGDDADVLIGEQLYCDNTNATLRFTPSATGVSPIQITGHRANITGCTLEVDLSNYSTDSGDSLVLIDAVNKASGTFGATNIVGGTADIIYDVELDGRHALILTNISVNASYSTWSELYLLEGSDADLDADPDSDGLANLGEYAFGGNPTNELSQGQQPWMDGDLDYIYQLIDDPGISAEIVTETDLVSGGTTVDVTFVASGPGVAGYINYTNSVDTSVQDVGFFSLELSYE